MAPPTIPARMKALVAPKYCKPEEYTLVELPTPKITRPDDVLIRVHAAGTTVGQLRFAKGDFSLLLSATFPMVIGFEGSGIVVAVGSDVKGFKVGDEVMGGSWSRPVFPSPYGGWMAEYTVTTERLLVPKPPHLSFEHCAGAIGTVVTAYQVFQRALELIGDGSKSFEGKTVFVPAAFSATGSVGVQMAKNVFGATRVISTVSTANVPLVDKHLPGIVDQVVDYRTQDVAKEIGREQVDIVYNTQRRTTQLFPLLKQQTGVIVSIAGDVTAKALRLVMGENTLPFWAFWLVNAMGCWYDWRSRGSNIQRDFVSGDPGELEALRKSGELIATEKIKPVSEIVAFGDLDTVREGMTRRYEGKGAFGSLVVKIL